ncbi:MAG: hypothetical protein IIB69_13840 [Proteobacteria bacterium]|nr:hypothetical protein [Pseudomonadota bacterium]
MGYFGSKGGAGVFQAIIAVMPPHDIYIESHLGGGAIMKNKPRAAVSIGCDINPLVVKNFGDDVFFKMVCGDARSFIDDFDYAGSRVLIYADPPYLHSTRSTLKRYTFDYSISDHLALIHSLKGAVDKGALVILSGYPSRLYDELLPGWRSIEIQAMTRGGPRTEKIWLSFPAGLVQSAKYAGKNALDRQRIKRKAARWKDNFSRLPPGERLAILSALLEFQEE